MLSKSGDKTMSEGTRIKPEFAATSGQWDYVCCECSVNIGAGVTDSITRDCEACGNSNLRFFCTLENPLDDRMIEVGIECARTLVSPDLWEIPRLAENEVARKERWRIHYRKPGRCYASIEDLEKRGVL